MENSLATLMYSANSRFIAILQIVSFVSAVSAAALMRSRCSRMADDILGIDGAEVAVVDNLLGHGKRNRGERIADAPA